MYHIAVIDVKEAISCPPGGATAADIFPTPWGWVGVAWSRRGVRRLVLPQTDRAAVARALAEGEGACPGERLWEGFRRLVRDYLAGLPVAFDLPLDLPPAREFTRRVRAEAQRIPRGASVTYGELARRAGGPGAARAVGQVMARNPVPLIVPCHRVVGAGGGLGGFAGGLPLKRALLDLEGAPR